MFNDDAKPVEEQIAWEDRGPLIGVLPIMKITRDGEYQYMLTHSMQHEKLSIVTAEIKVLNESAEYIHIEALLALVVKGKDRYEAKIHGGRGGNGETQLYFIVTPPLPEDLEGIEFSLLPAFTEVPRLNDGAVRTVSVRLDKPIDFK